MARAERTSRRRHVRFDPKVTGAAARSPPTWRTLERAERSHASEGTRSVGVGHGSLRVIHVLVRRARHGGEVEVLEIAYRRQREDRLHVMPGRLPLLIDLVRRD